MSAEYVCHCPSFSQDGFARLGFVHIFQTTGTHTYDSMLTEAIVPQEGTSSSLHLLFVIRIVM